MTPVVEKIYLRDQAVQSDPPPLGFEDHIIKEGAVKTVATTTAPPSRPLGALDRAHLLQKPTPVGPATAPGEAVKPKRELRWKFEDEDPTCTASTEYYMRIQHIQYV